MLFFCVALLALTARFTFAEEEKKGPKITNKVFFDVEIDGQAAGTYVDAAVHPRRMI